MEGLATDIHRQDLLYLTTADEGVVGEFARTAAGMAVTGEAPSRGFASAAKQLQVPVDVVENAVLALCHLMVGAAQANLPQESLALVAASLGFPEPSQRAVAEEYSERRGDIRARVSDSTLGAPSYKKLEWRLDVQLASRTLRHQAVPSFLLKLTTSAEHGSEQRQNPLTEQESGSENDEGAHYLVSDYETLKTLCSELELALAEARSARARRVARYFR